MMRHGTKINDKDLIGLNPTKELVPNAPLRRVG